MRGRSLTWEGAPHSWGSRTAPLLRSCDNEVWRVTLTGERGRRDNGQFWMVTPGALAWPNQRFPLFLSLDHCPVVVQLLGRPAKTPGGALLFCSPFCKCIIASK